MNKISRFIILCTLILGFIVLCVLQRDDVIAVGLMDGIKDIRDIDLAKKYLKEKSLAIRHVSEDLMTRYKIIEMISEGNVLKGIHDRMMEAGKYLFYRINNTLLFGQDLWYHE